MVDFELNTKRFYDDGDTTIGFFHCKGLQAFIVEDQKQKGKKIHGETRIPAGRYEIFLRAEGGMHKRYAEKLKTKHRGMLWLQDVPGFEWIYIHYGNTDDNTLGCPLINYGAHLDDMIGVKSVKAYLALCKIVYEQFDRGNRVFITVEDETWL